jgi:hypothetical protein
MKIETSHESPISCLDLSLSYNDYAYALVHLFEERPEYYNFFKKIRTTTNIPVLLDNSIFELGHSFDPSQYREWIYKLDPNYYIVPDVLESSSLTIDAWMEFNSEGIPPGPKQIGVVQGQTWTELVECYKWMSQHADYIAISFDYSYYQTTGFGECKLSRMSSGRQRFIQQLIDEGIWNWSKPHHLLGCGLAREFRYYVDKNINNIKSCDTSNPVVAAIKGIPYNDEFGLSEKPKTLLADLIDTELDDTQLELLDYNTKMFKKILRR